MDIYPIKNKSELYTTTDKFETFTELLYLVLQRDPTHRGTFLYITRWKRFALIKIYWYYNHVMAFNIKLYNVYLASITGGSRANYWWLEKFKFSVILFSWVYRYPLQSINYKLSIINAENVLFVLFDISFFY